MIYESRFALNGCYRVAGIGEIANDISKNGKWVNAINERGETPLHIAARYKKFELFKIMLPYFTNIEACDNQGNTVIHALLDNSIPSKNEKKCADLIEILMHKGGKVNKKNRAGWTPVHLAVRNCQIEVLNTLLKAKLDFSLRVENGETLLHLACKNMINFIDTPTEIQIINNLIIHGCNVNAKNDKGYSVLHYAVEYCGVRVVEKLIDCGTDLNCQTNTLQLTPLHLAVRKKNLDIISALLKSGANVNAVAHAKLTPLHLAVVIGSLDVANILKNKINDVDFIDQWSPLHMAIYLKRRDMFKLLIRQQANVDIPSIGGITPIHLASILGNFKFVKILIEYSANVNSRDKNNYTPLHLSIKDSHHSYLLYPVENNIHPYIKDNDFSKCFSAFLNISRDRDHKIISRFLLDNGADVNAVTKYDESALHFAAETGNVKLVKSLLRHGANVDCREKHEGFTPLHTATYWDQADVVKELMNANANLKVTSNDGKSALHMAAFYNRVSIIKEFVNAKVDLNITTMDGQSALHVATFHNHVDVVKELLNGNANIDVRSDDGTTPLHLAAARNHMKIFKLLFKHGAEVINGSKRLRNLPLHVAANENNRDLICYLMSFGCEMDDTNEDGFTALHCAVDKNNIDAANLLCQFGAGLNCKTKKYQLTPLHLALQRRCYATATLLINYVADVNVVDADGVTPLHLAALYHQELVWSLLRRGANVNCADKILEFTPLHIAVNEENEDMLHDLIRAGADVNVSDRHGLTPLHLATILGNCNFVKVLIGYGANINCRNNSSYTPMHFALRNERVMAEISAQIYQNRNSWISKSLNKSHEFVKQNYDNVIELLIELGSNLNVATKRGETLLHFAVEANAVKFIRILIEKGFDLNDEDGRFGMTPLQLAAMFDRIEVATLLISCGANVKVVTKCGKNLLHLAAEFGSAEILQYLLPSNIVVERCPFVSRNNNHFQMKNFEFDVNAKDYSGRTPLHLATLHKNRKREIETFLIYSDASAYVQDNNGLLPIHYTIEQNRHLQLECLLAFGIDVNDFKVYSKIHLNMIEYGTAAGIRMLQHLMKLKALEFPIANVYEIILRNQRYTEDIFYKECLKEIEKLRVHFVGRDVSLYNLLHIKRRGRRMYGMNINPREIEIEFPIYYSLILNVYHKTVVRENLMRKAEFALIHLTEVDLPVVCTDQILHYLGIVSLVTLIKASEIGRKNSRRSLCMQMKNPEGIHSHKLFYVFFYKMFNACEYIKEMILAFVCAAVLFLSNVPEILCSIFNK